MMSGQTLRYAIAAVVLLLGGLAVACGDSGARAQTEQASAPAPVAVQVVETDQGFVPDQISVSRGQVLDLTFVNQGTEVHNLHVAEKDGSYEPRGVAQPLLVQPGGTSKLTWQAPNAAGRFVFRCDFHPQHEGVITVR